MGHELGVNALEAASPPTPAELDAKAVHNQATDLQKLYHLAPASPEPSLASKVADGFLDLLPDSQAKSNAGDLGKLRDESVGLIGTIGQAVDQLMHTNDKNNVPAGGQPAFQDLRHN